MIVHLKHITRLGKKDWALTSCVSKPFVGWMCVKILVLDRMTSRGPFQPHPFCYSLILWGWGRTRSQICPSQGKYSNYHSIVQEESSSITSSLFLKEREIPVFIPDRFPSTKPVRYLPLPLFSSRYFLSLSLYVVCMTNNPQWTSLLSFILKLYERYCIHEDIHQ